MKNAKISPKVIGGMILAAIIIVAVFFCLNNFNLGNKEIYQKTPNKNTEVSAILDKDFDRFYPASVRETIRMYQRIYIACVNENYTEEEFYGLADQMRKLFDDELLEINPRDKHVVALYDEVSAMKNGKEKISSKNVQLESQVEFYKIGDDNMASIVGYFLVRNSKGKYVSLYYKYILREDENSNWRIVGWKDTGAVQFAD